ncbi:MAG: hypothetical protein FJ100_02315 [Deltaproteobacteria bacterium]|nr:hypothetical protein [Deltaproteobacteria bacterium]
MKSLAPLVAVLVAPACLGATATLQPTAELPVTKVVLYQNGVGYFERRGTVVGKDLELRVRPDQINDVLKSLTVLDLSGSVASSVSLPVERSGDEVAMHLPPEVRSAQGMMALLSVLRGAQVEVHGQHGRQIGRVVGVERSGTPDGDGKLVETPVLTLLAADDSVVKTPVAGIDKVVIGDKTLAVGLQQSMDIARRDGAWKPASVQVRLADDGSHDLLVSYIHEVPVWRPAYRAWVEAGKGVTLQGWAIVDNVSGEAWKDVDLTLVVGSPLSFRYNLHTPHRVPRPDLSSRLPQMAEAPPEPDVGYEEAPAPPPSVEAEKGYGGPAAGGGAPRPSARMRPSPKADKKAKMAESAADEGGEYVERQRVQQESNRRDAAIRQAQALVTGREVGALYTYRAQKPVTVPDRSAALINIVSRKADGQEVFLFREPGSGQQPYRAVLLRNGKESSLEGGPITLYVDGTFAGEGYIGRVGKDETTFIPYARESGFALNQRYDETVSDRRVAKIHGGRVWLQAKRVYTRTVAVESNRDQPSQCYVKLQRTGGTELVDPPKDLVKAGGEVFVPVAVPAKGKGEVKIVESTPISSVEAGLTPAAIDGLKYWLTNAKPDEALAGPIREALAVQDEISKHDQRIYELQQQRSTLDQEQQRIQSNLDALPQGAVAADLRKKLVGQLDDASRKAADVAKHIVEAQVKIAALREKLRVLLAGVELN